MIHITSDLDEIYAYFPSVERSLQDSARRILARYASMIEREAERSMDEGKSGRVYRIGGRYHTASAPYESPANLSGKLQRSINKSSVMGGLQWSIGSPVDYAKYLEEGTKYMAPRPLFKNALDKYRQDFINEIQRMVS